MQKIPESIEVGIIGVADSLIRYRFPGLPNDDARINRGRNSVDEGWIGVYFKDAYFAVIVESATARRSGIDLSSTYSATVTYRNPGSDEAHERRLTGLATLEAMTGALWEELEGFQPNSSDYVIFLTDDLSALRAMPADEWDAFVAKSEVPGNHLAISRGSDANEALLSFVHMHPRSQSFMALARDALAVTVESFPKRG